MRKSTVIGSICGSLAGIITGFFLAVKYKGKQVNELDKVRKFKKYYNMLNQWLLIRNEGRTLSEYFTNHGYCNIAVYGMGEMGNRFLEEIQKSNAVSIKYAIDQEADGVLLDLEVKTLEDALEPVDVIVVTAVFAYEDVRKLLKSKTDINVISLEDVIQELL